MKRTLENINKQLENIQRMMKENPSLEADLSDVWNTILDYRIKVIEDELPTVLLDTYDLRDLLQRYLRTEFKTCWHTQ